MNIPQLHINVNSWIDFQGNFNADNIRERCGSLKSKMGELEAAADRRKAALVDNSAFLQFMWKTDVVESWIGKC